MDMSGFGKILAVFAHPDDEVIFGWPLLQSGRVDALLICSNDLYARGRESTAHRKQVLEAFCKHLGLPLICLDHPSSFSRLSERTGERERCCSRILEHIGECDTIFTHNPAGEYGHEDHKLVFEICCHTNKPLIYSDMYVKTQWAPWKDIPQAVRRAWYRLRIGEFRADTTWLAKATAHYKQNRCWTWGFPVANACSLYTSQFHRAYLRRHNEGEKWEIGNS